MTTATVGAGWRLVAASVEGTSHAGTGSGCQDAHAYTELDGALIIAVADGAGSAARAADGAGLAVAAAVDHARHAAGRGGCLLVADDVTRVAEGCVDEARLALEVFAATDGCDLDELATTLLVVVAVAGRVGYAQVGDGAVVIDAGADPVVVGAVERGEYLNETVFLTSAGWRDELRAGEVDGAVEGEVDGEGAGGGGVRAVVRAVAVMTDGLQLLALDLASMTAHRPFFDPLWAFARRDDASSDELAAFLASDRVCARTDDDKTLVLAVLTPAAPEPSP